MGQFVTAAALVSLALGICSTERAIGQDVAAPPPPTPGIDAEGVETLTRGPVHEAFAAPTAKDPEPTDIVAKKPPEPIDEIAPDMKPEGAIWVPGYWEWDVATEDFIWISGLWRVPPPSMRWVPPYWTEVDGGWQRVPGFWMSAEVAELEYREPPPSSLDVGPSTPAPGENYFYVPGTWNYYDTGWRWRTGYWSPYRADWCWVPARWVWTPAGCIYSGGYWDRRPLHRGYLFAPVAFRSPIYLQPGWRYRPWCVLDTNRLFVHLWIGPRFNNYYFGNYYGFGRSRWGFTPWCDWHYGNRFGYDPLWSWANVHYRRQGIDYIGRVRGWHNHFERHEDARPARSWDDQRRQLAAGRDRDRDRDQNILAADFREFSRRDDTPIRLARVDERERERVQSVSEEIRSLHSERSRLEREARVASREDAGREGGERGPRLDVDRPGIEGRADVDRPGRTDRPGVDAGEGRGRRTARIALPRPSEQVREAADAVDRPPSLDTDRGDRPGSETGRTARTPEGRGDDRPPRGREPAAEAGQSVQDRIRAAREAAEAARTARGGEDRPEPRLDRNDFRDRVTEPRTTEPRTTEPRSTEPRTTEPRSTEPRTSRDGDRGPADRPGVDSSAVQDRIRAAREAADAARAARESRGPTERPTPRIERPDTPRVEQPRPETRRVEPRVETPRVERRVETPRVEAPRVERRVETPRIETRRVETPRVERSTPAPRVERSSPAPRVERSTPPRLERSAPRIESSRSSGSSRPQASRGSGSSSRPSVSRSSGSSSRSSGSSRSSSGRGRDRD
jgi:hypothetical protein